MSINPCIVIPFHSTALKWYEKISLHRCFQVLGNYDIFYACPASLRIDGTDFSNYPYRIKKFDDIHFSNLHAYNRLTVSPAFFEAFAGYSHILIYQLDCYVFKNELDYWANKGFDYIGAPWFWYSFTQNSALKNIPFAAGNSGFSLRNVEAALQVLAAGIKAPVNYSEYIKQKRNKHVFALKRWFDRCMYYAKGAYKTKTLGLVNERATLMDDVVWSLLVPEQFEQFKVASHAQAVPFAFETFPEKLFIENNNSLPFGVHAWQKYNPAFFKPFIEADGYTFPENYLEDQLGH